jgi:hypothetical protein
MLRTKAESTCIDILAARREDREARTRQTRFLVEHGLMSWRRAREMCQTERDALQATYAEWTPAQSR